MDAPDLRADCSRCAALCCVVLAFDRSEEFALDKPAGVPCPHLDDAMRCRIHADRARQGFSGCIGYDCLGAGQRVTQELFGGRSWRDAPELMDPMTRAFAGMRAVHRMLALLTEAQKAALEPDDRRALDALLAELNPEPGWTVEALDAVRDGALESRVRAFLGTLKRYFAAASDEAR